MREGSRAKSAIGEKGSREHVTLQDARNIVSLVRSGAENLLLLSWGPWFDTRRMVLAGLLPVVVSTGNFIEPRKARDLAVVL